LKSLLDVGAGDPAVSATSSPFLPRAGDDEVPDGHAADDGVVGDAEDVGDGETGEGEDSDGAAGEGEAGEERVGDGEPVDAEEVKTVCVTGSCDAESTDLLSSADSSCAAKKTAPSSPRVVTMSTGGRSGRARPACCSHSSPSVLVSPFGLGRNHTPQR